MTCELCELAAPAVYRDDRLSIIMVDDAAYPGFCRVIWNAHVKEMSDLAAPERAYVHEAVHQVELALRAVMEPAKINLASLGNMTPHVHWHVVPRFRDDRHFPAPIWAAPRRDEAVPPERSERAAGIAAALIARLGP